MAWTELSRKNPIKKAATDVTISCTGGAAGRSQMLAVVVPPGCGVGFWKAGVRVRVMLGTDIDAGKLRVVPHAEGDFSIARSPGKGGKGVLWLTPIPGLQPGRHQRTAVAHRATADAIDITLPSWAKPVEKKPFSMAATFDPVAASRRGTAPIAPNAAQRASGR